MTNDAENHILSIDIYRFLIYTIDRKGEDFHERKTGKEKWHPRKHPGGAEEGSNGNARAVCTASEANVYLRDDAGHRAHE